MDNVEENMISRYNETHLADHNPMRMMPWTAKKMLRNPEPLGSFFGELCLQAWRRNEDDFGRTVIDILEEKLGIAPLEEALAVAIAANKELVKV